MSSQKLSPQQIDQFKQTFNMFDVDGDGCITATELRSIMKKLAFTPTQEQINQMIKCIDTDKNGTIELNQFLNFIQTKMIGDEDELTELKAAFQLFDKNKDGLITRQELKTGFADLGEKMTDKELDQLIDAADTDGDGQINFQEFVQLMKYK